MNRILFLCSIVVLLIMFFSFAHGQDPSSTDSTDSTDNAITVAVPIAAAAAATPIVGTPTTTTAAAGTTQGTGVTTTTGKQTTTYRNSYSSGYGSRTRYGGTDGYYDNNNQVIGQGGIDPRKDGSDIGDFGPVYSNKKPMLASLDLFIFEADNSDKINEGQYDRGGDASGDKGYNGGSRSRRQVRFPVQQYKKPRSFPSKRFPPLISISPFVPIFYDKRTYQTVIFSPAGGIIIIPALINFYGRRFAVAQLIKWGYASLVSSGAPIGPGVDIAPLVRPPPPGGVVTAGVVGGNNAGPGPTYDSRTARFNDGVKTNFRDFKPRYSQVIEEGGSSNYDRSAGPGPNYGPDSNYGGSRNQQIYPQGGSRGAGGY